MLCCGAAPSCTRRHVSAIEGHRYAEVHILLRPEVRTSTIGASGSGHISAGESDHATLGVARANAAGFASAPDRARAHDPGRETSRGNKNLGYAAPSGRPGLLPRPRRVACRVGFLGSPVNPMEVTKRLHLCNNAGEM
jgi:hypothetical protein